MGKKLIIGLALVVLMASIGVVSATTGVFHGPIPNNQATCALLLPGSTEYRLDADLLYDGLHTNPLDGFKVEIGITNSQNIWWTSKNYPVDLVIVKDGSNDVNYYTYMPSAMSDTGLQTTLNSAGQVGGTSHIAFCYTPGTSAPEFPAVALPIGMIIGFLGLVLYVRGTREN